MRKHLNTKIAAVALGAVAVTGTGVAYAYWTTAGAGVGSATAGTAQEADRIKLLQPERNGGFYPGGSAQDVLITATNPAAFNQVVGEVTVTLTSNDTDCAADNWRLENVADAFGNVAPGATTAPQKVATLQLRETGVQQDGCKDSVPVLTFASAGGE